MKIYSVSIEKVFDEGGDLSYLGEFSNTPGEGAIDRAKVERYLERGEYRYFNPANYDKNDPNRNKYALEDYKRMMEFIRGKVCLLGIYATCSIDYGGCYGEIRTPGLWGIESDSDPEYMIEIAKGESKYLLKTLIEIGFKKREVSKLIEESLKEFRGDL